MSTTPPTSARILSRPLIAFRLVQWATLVSLVWKLGGFIQMWRCYVAVPLHQDFFPRIFQSANVLGIVYVVACVSLAVGAMTTIARRRRISAWVGLITMSVLCIHQGSYNDATFVTGWWAELWSVWLAGRLEKDAAPILMQRAARVARGIVSLILLGGAAGKWTDEYWSGQVLYEIYFIDRDFWLFNLLRSMLDAESLREVATWYSRQVIVVETLCGLTLWALPPRWSAIIALAVLTSIALLSNFHLFSVLLSLIGLAATGLLVNASNHDTTSLPVEADIGH